MNCKEIEQLLSAYIDGELENQEKSIVSSHLKECPKCLKTKEQLERTVALVKSLKHVEAPSNILVNVREELEKKTIWIKIKEFLLLPLTTRQGIQSLVGIAAVLFLVIYINSQKSTMKTPKEIIQEQSSKNEEAVGSIQTKDTGVTGGKEQGLQKKINKPVENRKVIDGMYDRDAISGSNKKFAQKSEDASDKALKLQDQEIKKIAKDVIVKPQASGSSEFIAGGGQASGQVGAKVPVEKVEPRGAMSSALTGGYGKPDSAESIHSKMPESEKHEKAQDKLMKDTVWKMQAKEAAVLQADKAPGQGGLKSKEEIAEKKSSERAAARTKGAFPGIMGEKDKLGEANDQANVEANMSSKSAPDSLLESKKEEKKAEKASERQLQNLVMMPVKDKSDKNKIILEIPKDFNFVLKYGVGAKNILDTFKGDYTKDLISSKEETATVKLKLTQEEMKNIYNEMIKINILGYPQVFIPYAETRVKPNITYYLKIQINGKVNEIYWSDQNESRAGQAVKLRNLIENVIKIIETKEEYKKMPPAEGGYQ